MRILLTGASSFTGAWFARELTRAGHAVTATFTAGPDAYDGLRRERIDHFTGECARVWNAPFGSPDFLDLCRQGFDVLCHHGAYVTGYKNDDFDYLKALSSNARNLPEALTALAGGGLARVVLTGSVFEADEGAGHLPRQAFSPYGLSKTLTAEVFRFHCHRAGVALGKFVIPNPFGPYEEPRFTNYLVRTWARGETASVRTPAYVRDNIHVSLLSKLYAGFVAGQGEALRPSGYVETQGAFAERFARAMQGRLHLPCGLRLETQTDFNEPLVRLNTDITNTAGLDWDENRSWDDLADYYRSLL